MFNQIYERQQSPALGIIIPDRVGIVGIGGVGFNCALQFALAGVPELVLCDGDRIEPCNLNRIPLPQDAVGKYKTEAAWEFILKLRPHISVLTFNLYLDETNVDLILHDVPIIIACTDSIESQQTLAKYAAEQGKTFIRSGSDGNHLTVTDHVPMWTTDAETGGSGYTIGTWIAPCAAVAALTVFKILVEPAFTFAGSLSDISTVKER